LVGGSTTVCGAAGASCTIVVGVLERRLKVLALVLGRKV
jgi:hypothetical protein